MKFYINHIDGDDFNSPMRPILTMNFNYFWCHSGKLLFSKLLKSNGVQNVRLNKQTAEKE